MPDTASLPASLESLDVAPLETLAEAGGDLDALLTDVLTEEATDA